MALKLFLGSACPVSRDFPLSGARALGALWSSQSVLSFFDASGLSSMSASLPQRTYSSAEAALGGSL
jgi:hypothetical protein